MAISKVVYKSSPSATPVTWMDATTATAAAADITAPKTAMLADGVVTTGTGSGGGGLNYEVGSFTIDEDIRAGWIPHTLGAVPKVVIVWQTTITRETEAPTVNVNGGFCYLDGIVDLNQKLTTSASTAFSLFANMAISANTNVSSFGGPTSASYCPDATTKPTSSALYLYNSGNTAWAWRAGVQYHYFVSEAWWT